MTNTKEAVKKISDGKIKNPLAGTAKGVDVNLKNPLSLKPKMSGSPDSKSSKVVKKILGK